MRDAKQILRNIEAPIHSDESADVTKMTAHAPEAIDAAYAATRRAMSASALAAIDSAVDHLRTAMEHILLAKEAAEGPVYYEEDEE